MSDLSIAVAAALAASFVAVIIAGIALVGSRQPGPRGPQGKPGETYYPMLAVHEVKPGSVLHFHNVDFGDEETDARAVTEIAKGIGHTDFIIVRTEGNADSPEMVGVWPEGEFADRVRALYRVMR